MIKRKHLFLSALASLFALSSTGQEYLELHNSEVIQMDFLGETSAYRDWDASKIFPNPIVRDAKGLLIEHEEREGKGLHLPNNPNALPNGADPIWQQTNGTKGGGNGFKALDLSIDGIGNTGVNPADPCLDVGPNHVIQMINGGSGSYFQIFDKSGNALGAQTYLDNFTGSVGGAGDPIVLYDAMVDRWMMSEFASSGNRLLVAVSTTSDPTGTWYAYEFTTPNFPDYPKYGIWNGMYIVTTNESGPSAVYALDRTKMLAGDASATSQRFTTPDYPTIGFQATTPITFDGGALPPAGAPAMIMRMADDAWDASITNDRLEIWTLDVDFATPANSAISGPTYYSTQPFDTELCGYTSFSCIDQPNTATNLDPLREVIMNRAQYRNMGTHEVIVCNHVTDVDNTDHGGVRWYELRRTGGIAQNWNIFQQGTYAPDADHRWMAGISINDAGDIAMAYSVSGASTFPSMRYTGRSANDPLGQMTVTETSIIVGTSNNGSNRWGDYFSLDTDPSTGSFWGTGVYNTSTAWSTRIFEFSMPVTSPDYSLGVVSNTAEACQPGNALYSIQIGSILGYTDPVTLSTTGLPGSLVVSFSPNPVVPIGNSTLTISNTGSVASGTYPFTLNAASNSGAKSLPLTLVVTGSPGAIVLISPLDGATGIAGASLLNWAADANATAYEIDIATDLGMSNIVESSSGSAATSYAPSIAIQSLTTYYWRVRGTSTCGNGAWSATWSFTTGDCVPVEVFINTDRYGSETTWSLEDINNTVVLSGGPYTDQGANGVYPVDTVAACLASGCYDLIINDTFGDGFCCAYGVGSIYVLDANGFEAVINNTFNGDVDTTNFCLPVPCSMLPISNDFEIGLGNWAQDSNDDLDWTLNSGGTPSNNTGPSGDHTTGSGNYLYIEASNPNFPSKFAGLLSGCVDLSGLSSSSISFWYHMYGGNVGSLHLDIKQAGIWTEDIWSLSGDQTNQWIQASVDLSAYSGSVELRFRAFSGPDANDGWGSDISLDDILISGTSGVKLNAKVFLEGPYNTGSGQMDDDLRVAALVPTTEPFTGLLFTHVGGGGGETINPVVLDATGSNAIVDWLLIELRDKNDNTSVLRTKSVLVQADGDVVDLDGVSNVTIEVAADNYFVAFRHRNHLGFMTQNAQALNSTALLLNTTNNSIALFGTEPLTNISGTMCMWAGNTVLDTELKYTGANNDRDLILTRIGGVVPTATVAGYELEDVTLDGIVKYTGADNDRDPILVNIGGTVPTAVRTEQLP